MDLFCIHRQVVRVCITSLLNQTWVANKNLRYFWENNGSMSALKVEPLAFLQEQNPNQDRKFFDGMLSILLKYFMTSEKGEGNYQRSQYSPISLFLNNLNKPIAFLIFVALVLFRIHWLYLTLSY